MFAYATCMWLRHCDLAGEVMGSACSETINFVVHHGTCFRSDIGSLECGRLSGTDDEYGRNPILFNTSGPVRRCPTGNPAKQVGTFVSKRTRSAGCMITNDANYDPYAEVHVPAYCAVPTDFMPGCLLPAGLNFNPSARQSAECRYPTIGCTDPTAVNFNSRATISATPSWYGHLACIASRPGCTVAPDPYSGVAPTTPGYRSGFYGSAASGSGGVAYGKVAYVNASVINWDPTANVLQNCQVAVEGCMDPSARNYDPNATINTNTWCVPRVVGCMVPDEAHAGASYRNPQNVSIYPHIIPHKPDEPTLSFNLSVTQHEPSMCGSARYGCTDSTAINYDPLATVQTTCYSFRLGCLNPAAVNFGCPSNDFDSNCTLPNSERVTSHSSIICKWTVSLSPSPPPPAPVPAGVDVISQVQFRTDVADTLGNVLASEPDYQQAFVTWMNCPGGCPVGDVEFVATQLGSRRLQTGASVNPASIVNIFMSITLSSAAAATTAQNNLISSVGNTATSLEAALAAAGVPVSVLTAPTIGINTTYVPRTSTSSSSSGSSGVDASVLIGAIVGGVCALLILAAIALFYFRRKSSKVGKVRLGARWAQVMPRGTA